MLKSEITGLVLAGGRGSRMGGLDKGLQDFHGRPLAQRALQRLAPQVGSLLLNANRNLETYAAFGAPVWPDGDDTEDYAGPLAGFLAGLAHCDTPWLLTVPCDTPLFPSDLAARLAEALEHDGADLAIASAPDRPGEASRAQPVFCLMRVSLRESLRRFIAGGGRKIGAWTARQNAAVASFDRPGDDARAFVNVNTLEELEHWAADAAARARTLPSPSGGG